MRNVTKASCIMALTLLLGMIFVNEIYGDDWQTFYEKSGGLETPRYAETLRYFERLDQASSFSKLTFFGTSPEGRKLPLFIISRDRCFTPAAAQKSGKLIVLIQGCIHAGESDGKDAMMLLARDLLIARKYPEILQELIILMVPIFNVDGHERFSAFQRINQNGPKEMGWRATATRLNLNRDFLKADAPEMSAWLSMYHQWSPHFFYDCHTTDGVDFQYVLTYNIDEHEVFGGAVSRWAKQSFLPAIQKRCEEAGMIIGPYAEPRDYEHPEKGFIGGVWRPMLSNVYATICNRAGFLIETHALKPYRVRVQATLDFILFGLQELAKNGAWLKKAVAEEDKAMSLVGAHWDTSMHFPLQFRTKFHAGESMIYRGYQATIQQGAISGRPYLVYRPEAMDVPTVYYNEVEPTVSVVPPIGYLIPPAWRQIIDVLDAHRIDYKKLPQETQFICEVYRLKDVKFRNTPYEGRQIPSFQVSLQREERAFMAGTIYVPLANPKSRLIMHLLEPQAPDALVAWGLINTIFEEKEYFESYVMEPLAQRMMAMDEDLAQSFRKKLATDSAFAANSRARLRFFYEHSPYFDREKDLYPVFRVIRPMETVLQIR